MLAEDCLREGNLPEALAEVENAIKRDPAEVKHRVFLFQLLAVMGDWKRALTQLSVVANMDDGALMMVETCRTAIQCEALRSEVFAGRRSPMIFGEPQPWVASLLESLRQLGEGHAAAAVELRDRAFEQADAVAGTITTRADGEADGKVGSEVGQAFRWIADADGRIGPMLETIMNGAYYWVPFQCIRSSEVEEPADLRDFVWTPVHIKWTNEGETVALVPSRYPGSEEQADGLVQLGRKTEWIERSEGVVVGIGQRLLATDVDEYPLLDIRRIEFDDPQTAAE